MQSILVDTRAQCNWYKVQKDTSSSMKRESKHYKTPEYFDFNSACSNIETTNKSLIHWFWKFWTIKFLFLDQFELNFMIKSKLTLKLANGVFYLWKFIQINPRSRYIKHMNHLDAYIQYQMKTDSSEKKPVHLESIRWKLIFFSLHFSF